MELTEDDFCPICEDIMEPDDVTGEVRCLTDHAPDNYDTLFVQRGAEEAFRIAADDARKLRAGLTRLREAGHGAERAIAERIRQKSVEGWTPEHDAQHDQGELAIAAACYALNKMPVYSDYWWDEVREWWPWHPDWDKREKHDRERSLEIAAALIMAELDRIHTLRAALKSVGEKE